MWFSLNTHFQSNLSWFVEGELEDLVEDSTESVKRTTVVVVSSRRPEGGWMTGVRNKDLPNGLGSENQCL